MSGPKGKSTALATIEHNKSIKQDVFFALCREFRVPDRPAPRVYHPRGPTVHGRVRPFGPRVDVLPALWRTPLRRIRRGS